MAPWNNTCWISLFPDTRKGSSQRNDCRQSLRMAPWTAKWIWVRHVLCLNSSHLLVSVSAPQLLRHCTGRGVEMVSISKQGPQAQRPCSLRCGHDKKLWPTSGFPYGGQLLMKRVVMTCHEEQLHWKMDTLNTWRSDLDSWISASSERLAEKGW